MPLDISIELGLGSRSHGQIYVRNPVSIVLTTYDVDVDAIQYIVNSTSASITLTENAVTVDVSDYHVFVEGVSISLAEYYVGITAENDGWMSDDDVWVGRDDIWIKSAINSGWFITGFFEGWF